MAPETDNFGADQNTPAEAGSFSEQARPGLK
jgi:hypothetical protein